MMNWKEAILHRRSCRTFDKCDLSASDIDQILSLVDQVSLSIAPFANIKVRAKWLGRTPSNNSDNRLTDDIDLKQFGTYGFIKNCPGFIGLAVKRGEGDLENLGFVGEKLVLELTKLRISTCWLGGSFTKSKFSQAMNCSDDELLPAVLAVGYAASRPSLIDRAVRWSARSSTRIRIEQIVLPTPSGDPLPVAWAHDLIGAIQLAPSASNKQPWRLSLSENYMHFYRAENPAYQRILKLGGLANLQRLDLGIALAHGYYVAEELGLSPQIEVNGAQMRDLPSSSYVFSLKIST